MKKKQKVYNLIILDESGSMETVKEVTISGFNELIQTIKSSAAEFTEQEHRVSFVVFNSDRGAHTIIDNQNVEILKPLTDNDYQPGGMTPLYDAMGLSITRLMQETYEQENFNVLVTILTDGLENNSKEYNEKSIKDLIDKLKATGKWTFTYMGANHKVEKVASSMSINNSIEFEQNEEDMKGLFSTEVKARKKFYKKLSKKQIIRDDDYFKQDDDS